MKKIIYSVLRLKHLFYLQRRRTKLFFQLLSRNTAHLNLISQIINYKSIPIIIISFNQLFYLRKLIEVLQKYKYSNIVIIDNNSTYQPLLEYFDTIESSVTIYRLKENLGHTVFWRNRELFKKYSKGYYVLTDPDIIPIDECPEDFVLHFKRILDKYLQITKVGFSLKIDDIPESNPNKQKVINWESQFWKNQNNEGDYYAAIDTTFALYRPNSDYQNLSNFLSAIRTNKPYTAMHGGWYFDIKNLTEEQNFYLKVANESSSWKIDPNGKLYTKDYG